MTLWALFRDLISIVRLKTDDPDVAREQVRVMELQVPWLYFTLLINGAALVYTFYGVAPDYLTIWPLCAWSVIFVARLTSWFINRNKSRSHDENITKLKSLLIVGIAVGIGYNLWGMQFFRYGDALQQGHVAVFLCITVIGTLCSLIQFPPLTLSLICVAITTFITYALLKGSMVILTMAISFVLIMLVVMFIIKIIYSSFYGQIIAQRELAQSQAQVEAANEELRFHRDNLQQEVRKRTQELEDALASQKELNRLQNEFVSMVSHEFRTPLTIIDGTARRIEKSFAKLTAEDAAERAQKIRTSVLRLTLLIERTLDAARLASGRMQINPANYDLKALVSEAIERQQDIHLDFEFTLDTSALPETVYGDARLMDNVVTNLLSNAVKYSGDSRQIDVMGSCDGETVTFSVHDYGIGIPREDLANISDRFFRASNAAGIQGTGIGMNLVRSLIDLHQGYLTIESEEGEWTKISIQLPVHPEFDLSLLPQPPSETEASDETPSGHTREVCQTHQG